MQLIAAVLLAGPLGYFARTPRLGVIRYVVLWALILPVQTVVVSTTTDTSVAEWSYWAANAIFLALGIGLCRLGARVAQRRGRYVVA